MAPLLMALLPAVFIQQMLYIASEIAAGLDSPGRHRHPFPRFINGIHLTDVHLHNRPDQLDLSLAIAANIDLLPNIRKIVDAEQ
jgi:hypothetical protein